MATAQAKAMHEANGRLVYVVGGDGRSQWPEEIFANNPRLTRREVPGSQRLVSGGGVRPYIVGKTAERWYWKTWPITPGELYFTPAEKTWAEQYRGRILIEPTTKVPRSNKAWLPERWQSVADKMDVHFTQVGPRGTLPLRGVRWIHTTFREAVAILSVSRAFVGTEGAMHHAAAALGIPAVVLWSEYISPDYTGYATQRNIRHAGSACGARLPCDGCKESMLAISVDEVVGALTDVLR